LKSPKKKLLGVNPTDLLFEKNDMAPLLAIPKQQIIATVFEAYNTKYLTYK